MPTGVRSKLAKLASIAVASSMVFGSITLVTSASQAAVIPKPGASCSKLWQKITYRQITYTCVRVSGKLVWNKGVRVAAAKPAPSLPAKPQLALYTGGAGAADGANDFPTPELNFTPQAETAGTNLRIFLYDPRNSVRAINSPGLFLKSASSDWKFYSANSDGSLYLQLADGEYSIDTVEPSGQSAQYLRKFYSVTMSGGKADVEGVKANSKGFFGMTFDVPDSDNEFSPANQCQLRGQDGNLAMNVGFPARSDRLVRQGQIRAIIIPVDFADAPGFGTPAETFYDMAVGTDKFFRQVSDNRVTFNFQILPKYLRMPFSPSQFKLGNWSQGDAEGYWRAAIKAADPHIDYSKFDVVYVVSPPSIAASAIAYGPAFPKKYLTNDGFVKNGTFSGADAYQSFSGAGWKWMAHETGHLFGLHDLYTVDPTPATFGSWEIMSLNWTNRSIELTTWNRFILDWLRTDQYDCFSSSELTGATKSIDLVPVGSSSAGKKSVFVKLSDSLMLVAEFRATAGLDVIPTNESGLLVYTVDMKIGSIRGGWKVIRPARSTTPAFEDAALQIGESVEVQGIKLTVVSKSASQLQLRVN